MTCPSKNRETSKLLDYCAHKLSAEETAAFERHIADCSDCCNQAAANKAIWDAMSEWDASPVSADFNRRLFARIDLEESRNGGFSKWARSLGARWTLLSWYSLSRQAMLPAAGVAIVIGALFIPWTHQNARTGSVPPSAEAKVERIDADQVERALDDLDMLKQLGAAGVEGKSPGAI